MSVSAISTTVGSFHVARPRSRRLRMAVRSGAVSVGPILTKLRSESATPLPLLRHVADAMAADMRAGLRSDGGDGLQMILSYVDSLPTGNEKGLFYALDLGGTNFRVLRVQLGGKEERVIATEFEQVSIPQDLMFGTSEGMMGCLCDRDACTLLTVLIEHIRIFELPQEKPIPAVDSSNASTTMTTSSSESSGETRFLGSGFQAFLLVFAIALFVATAILLTGSLEFCFKF